MDAQSHVMGSDPPSHERNRVDGMVRGLDSWVVTSSAALVKFNSCTELIK